MTHDAHRMSSSKDKNGLKAYAMLGLMTLIMYLVMYLFMFAMINTGANFFNNINQAYMAGLMTAPMVLIELAIMRQMYQNTTANVVVTIAAILFLAISWFGIREQWGVNDNQFLRSMIPHHAGAILMCEQAPLQSAEIKSLCIDIVQSQQGEIAEMKALLANQQVR